jgi:hypothetical protein
MDNETESETKDLTNCQNMDAEEAATLRKKWWRRITRSEVVVLGTIIVFFSLVVFLRGQKSFLLIPFQISNITGKHICNFFLYVFI